MKQLLFTAILTINFQLLTIICSAQTTIPAGNVSGHWTLAGSPYNINGSLVIPSDSTLLIDPGVTISFQTSNHYGVDVQGRILAVGTAAQNIFITATDSIIGFGGFRFNTLAPTNDTSKFMYCNIQYGVADSTSQNGGALYFNNWSSAIISHCTIDNCSSTYLTGAGGAIYANAGTIPITYCSFTNDKVPHPQTGNNWYGGYGGAIYMVNNYFENISYNTFYYDTASYGGAISLNAANTAVITNNTFYYCFGYSSGGAVSIDGSSTTIDHNSFSHNTTYGTNGGGGGLGVTGTTASVSNNFFTNNYSGNPYGLATGGAIFIYNTGFSLTNNTITYNNAGTGGGISITFSNGGGAIIGNTITHNTAQSGGGINLYAATITSFSHNIISGNSALTGGGGMYGTLHSNYGGIFSSMDNCIFTNNSCTGIGSAGGGFAFGGLDSLFTMTNVTIANNTASNGGGAYFDAGSSAVFKNCIIYGNTGITGQQVYMNDSTHQSNFIYSDIQGGQSAIGIGSSGTFTGIYQNNIDADPLFVAPSAGSGASYLGTYDWTLQESSPCWNTGDPTGPYPTTDLAGNVRVVGSAIDMGAYEYQMTVAITTTPVSCHGGTNGTATANVTNGSPNYTYFWSTSPLPQTTQTATGLAAGTYTVTVTDALNSTATKTVTIAQPSAITISTYSSPASCINNDGSALAVASGGTPPYHYQWSNNATTTTITGLTSSTYTITVADTNNCNASTTVAVAQNNSLPPAAPSICEVSVDSIAGNNQYVNVYWDKTIFHNVDSVIIYRYCPDSARFLRIGAVPNNSATLSRYTDVALSVCGSHGGDPTYTYYQYKIAVHDTCGNYSPLSLYHQSVNFVYNSGTQQFNWDEYQIENSPPIQGYKLMKDSLSNGNWVEVTSAVGTVASDPNYSVSPFASYRVDALGFNCAATRASISTTHSNIKHQAIAFGINQLTMDNAITIYPNPANETVTIDVSSSKFKVSSLKVFNAIGEVVYQSVIVNPKSLIDISKFAKGIYTVEVDSENGNVFKKLVVQ